MPLKKIATVLLSLLACILLALGVGAEGEAEDKIVLVLDPGHGGHDPGTTMGTKSEADYNYDVALLLKEKLEATGDFEVHLTRARDEYKKYLIRAQVAYECDADVLISLHFNSYGWYGSSPNGVEVLGSVLDEWYPHTLATSISQSISSECGLRNGGVKRVCDTGDSRGVYYWNEALDWDIPGGSGGRISDYYSMIAWGTKLGFPSIIVEHAYLSNPANLAFCDSADGLNKLASAEARAIINYFTGHTHTYAPESCDRSANCCIGGVYSEKCTICSHRRNVRHTPIDPSVHAYVTTSAGATCTTDGYVRHECQISRNLSEKGFDYISVHTAGEVYKAYGHNLVTEVDTAASHGVDGLFRQRCTNCNAVFDEVRYGEAHNYVNIESVKVTCTSDGHDTYECTICSHSYSDVTAAEGHVWEAEGTAIDCSSDGTLEYTCRICSLVSTEAVEVPPHSFEEKKVKSPSCEKDGYKLFVCTTCGAEQRETLSATGHDFAKEHDSEILPTYFKDGERIYKCKNDPSHEKSEVIPKDPAGIFIVIGASAAAVACFALVAWLLISAGRRRIREVAACAGEELEKASSDGENIEEASAEVAETTEIPEESLVPAENTDSPVETPTEEAETEASAEAIETTETETEEDNEHNVTT